MQPFCQKLAHASSVFLLCYKNMVLNQTACAHIFFDLFSKSH